jgi:hypothetical protein
MVEAAGECGSQFEPASSRIPGDPFDASNGRLPHPVHTHAGNLIEKRPGFVEPIIWGARGRAEGPATPGATVTAAPALPGPIERMDHDVALAEPTVEGAIAVGAGPVFDRVNPHETCSDL